MNIDWGSAVFLVAVVYALTEYVKKNSKKFLKIF